MGDARNALLALPAVIVLAHGWGDTGTSATAWVTHVSGSAAAGVGGLLVAAALAGQWALIMGLLRQNGRILLRLEVLSFPEDPGSANSQGESLTRSVQLPLGSTAPSQ